MQKKCVKNSLNIFRKSKKNKTVFANFFCVKKVKKFIKTKKIKNLIKPCKNVSASRFQSVKFPEYMVIAKEKKTTITTEDLLKEQKEEIKKQNKKRNFSIWFFIANIVVIACIFTYNALTGGVSDIRDLFTGETYWRYLFIGIGIYVLLLIIDSLKFAQLIHKGTGRFRFWTSFKTHLLGKYYDNLTPMSTGGQPFQIFYLKSRGIRSDIATTIPLAKFIVWQFVNAFICAFVLITQRHFYADKNWIVVTLAWASLAGMLFIVLSVLLLSLSKKVMPKFVMSILKFGQKIKLVKNYKATFRRVLRFVREYQVSMKSYIKHFPTMVTQILTSIVTIFLNALIPFFIYKAFNPFGLIGPLEIITNLLICDMASSLFPLPGGSGAAELSFATVFAKYFPSNFLVWALVMWRLVSYYSYIVFGALVLGYDTIWGNRKNEALIKAGFFKEKPKKNEVFKVDNTKK